MDKNASKSNSKGNILWIDDEIELLRPHIILLEQRGYSVDIASNGEDAIELVKGKHFEIWTEAGLHELLPVPLYGAIPDYPDTVRCDFQRTSGHSSESDVSMEKS